MQLEVERKATRIENLKRVRQGKHELPYELASHLADKMTPFKTEKKVLKPVMLSPRPKPNSSWKPIADYLNSQNIPKVVD